MAQRILMDSPYHIQSFPCLAWEGNNAINNSASVREGCNASTRWHPSINSRKPQWTSWKTVTIELFKTGCGFGRFESWVSNSFLPDPPSQCPVIDTSVSTMRLLVLQNPKAGREWNSMKQLQPSSFPPFKFKWSWKANTKSSYVVPLQVAAVGLHLFSGLSTECFRDPSVCLTCPSSWWLQLVSMHMLA